jgi:hypothetical protein
MSRNPGGHASPRTPYRKRATPDRAGSAPRSNSYGPADSVPRLWSLAIALAAFAVYLIQCAPVSGDKDSAEFTLVLALNSVAHPTGYPLFVLLGHFFVRFVHALGATWAYAGNAWAALGGGVAIYCLHRLAAALPPAATRLGRRARFLLALLPVALFAFNPVWTYETTLAEVYSWHIAWVLGTSLYFVRLVRELSSGQTQTARQLYGHAALWGLLCGVGGAHHATSIFVATPLSIAILVALTTQRRLRTGLVATVLAATCVPLLSYGIIPWRATHPAVYQWPTLAPGLAGLLAHMSGSVYQGMLGRFAPSPQQAGFLVAYVYPFLLPGLLLTLVNAVRSRAPGERVLQWGLAGSALLGTACAFNYGAADPSSYFLQPMTLGLVAITPLLGSLVTDGRAPRHLALTCAALLAVPWLRIGQQRAGLWVSFDRQIHQMWMAIPADSAIVFWTDDLHTKLFEYQFLRGEKPGLTVVHGLTLYQEPVRNAFIRRHGFDPVAGIRISPNPQDTPAAQEAGYREAIDAAESNVNQLTRLPVIHFDPNPARPSLRLLLKPGADSSATMGMRDRLPPGTAVQSGTGRP